MIFMSDRSAKNCHDTVTGELVDGSLISVDLIHQDFETTVNDFVDFFGIKHFGDRRIVGDVGKQNGYQLALTFNGTAGGENFIRKELGCIGWGFAMVNRGAIFRAS